MSTEQAIRADERRKCAQELRDYAKGLTSEAVAHITADKELEGLNKIHRAAAIDSAAKILESAP